MNEAEPAQAKRPTDGQGLLTANRLQQLGLLNGATRYLEIGVFKGATFLGSEPIKVLVMASFH